MPVHHSHGTFVFEVTSDSKPSDDCFRAGVASEIDGETAEWDDFDVCCAFDGYFDHIYTFLDVEGYEFEVSVVDGDDEGIKQRGGPSDHVGVSVGHRVESAWVQSYDVAHRCVSGSSGVSLLVVGGLWERVDRDAGVAVSFSDYCGGSGNSVWQLVSSGVLCDDPSVGFEEAVFA